MPTLDDKSNQEEMLLRLMFYGAGKTRKTWLAGTAAEAGFNTILLDCDHGYHVLTKNLSEAAKKRLMLFPIWDSLKINTASVFMARFLKQSEVLFNELTRRVEINKAKIDKNYTYLSVEDHLNKNTVIIIDSYTALVQSITMRYARENQIDLSDALKQEWDGYGWCGRLASWMIDGITRLPCHVIMIGHQTQYDKHSKNAQGKDQIDWSRRVIKSVSNPHSLTITDKFSDILYFTNMSATLSEVDARAAKDAEGGSRVIPPKKYVWEQLPFKKICEYAKIPLPPANLPYLNFTPTIPEGGASVINIKPNINQKPAAAKLTGLSLLNKGKKS